MRSSRDDVLALINRWQSENCVIKVEFNTTDHSLEISCPPILHVRLDSVDDSTVWISEIGPRESDVGRIYGIHIKLTEPDGYEIINLKTDAPPHLRAQVDFNICLRIPYGNLGSLYIFAMEAKGPQKVM